MRSQESSNRLQAIVLASFRHFKVCECLYMNPGVQDVHTATHSSPLSTCTPQHAGLLMGQLWG